MTSTGVQLDDTGLSASRGSRWQALCEILLIFLVFFIHGASPAPEVNEAHYLSKAKHYWNPQWCERDLFCSAADAHQVFYWTFGWLTLWLPLPAVAWIGRLLTWSLLAWAWRRLSVAVVPARFAAVLSAGLFLTLLHRAHLAGEWVVGGVEAKGFAFVFGLLGIEAVVRNRWNRACLWLGAAAAFHVLVGGWLVVAAGLAWLVMRYGTDDKPPVPSPWALLAGGLLSLPGLIPAIMLMRGVDPSTAAEAARIYVFERLPHHLVPQKFPAYFLARFTVLLMVWIALVWRQPLSGSRRRLTAMVNGSLLIAAAGLAISFATVVWGDQMAPLLRYYWFRTSDVLLPLGLGLMLTAFVVQKVNERSRMGVVWLTLAMLAVGGHLVSILRDRGPEPIAPADNKMQTARDWRELCEWASANTPSDAVFLTPRTACSFRWYSNRAEVATWKDIPQDAAGIVAWWKRMCDVHHRTVRGKFAYWQSSLSSAPPEELVRLGNKYNARYLITESSPPLPFELVSPPNASYAIYRLPTTWETPTPPRQSVANEPSQNNPTRNPLAE